MSSNLILNPLERFTKAQLNKKGCKLAFIDSSALNDLINPKIAYRIGEAFAQILGFVIKLWVPCR